MRVFVGDPPVSGLGVCRWVAKRIGKKRCDLKADQDDDAFLKRFEADAGVSLKKRR